MRAFSVLVLLLAEASAAWPQESSPRARPVVLKIRLENQAISPVTARFIERAIRQAEEQRAECLILVLDTPGGLVDSTRGIVRNILGSQVPVVVYVAPSGARAASAGVFITLAAHVAAMAPGTNIGAAHPVQIGGLPGAPPQKDDDKDSAGASPLKEKILNDTVAWARALAELRGRNVDWAVQAVRESVSAPASEAVSEGAVDFMAEDIDDLLTKIDGRNVKLPHGEVQLRTAQAELQTLQMWWGESILAILTNPNAAFLLLMFGFYGILFELYTPGWGLAGTLGIVCLLLGFFGLAVLPINYAGLALLAVGLALFVAEVFVTSYGALTVAGIVCLVLGGTMLVDSPAGFQRVSLTVIAPVALATAFITIFLVGSIVRTHRGRVQIGLGAWTGADAIALEDFSSDHGRYAGVVKVRGEIWTAVSPAPVKAGEPVAIQQEDGLTLVVIPESGVGSHESGIRSQESEIRRPGEEKSS